ncbi:M14 family metallopeptidase [Bacteroidota bacterium]
MRNTRFLIVLVLLFTFINLSGQESASDPQFKVKIDFNRWHDVPDLWKDMRKLEKAFPQLLKVESIGKSYDGLDILVGTINNENTGPEMSKAAMYIDANMHGNEIQGGEVCLYTLWYLLENYGKIEKITQLVDQRVFYVLPCVNPDGRQLFMEGDGGGSRTGHVPVDGDNDGIFDEDGPNDINGNGVIDQIRKYVPGQGTHRINQDEPRMMEAVGFGETGDYILLGMEGIDDDNDGLVNEDGPGSYDPNRNFASDWQPDYIQGGAMDYPFQLPETRAMNDFLMAHPNIAGVRAYHNSGGMICRGPGSEAEGEYEASDLRVYDELAKNGERILPFYRYIVFWSGMYTIHGGFTDWTNDGLGIISLLNELWSGEQYFTSPELKQQTQNQNSPVSGQKGDYFFDDNLEFGDQFIDWEKFDHPQYGEVEMGGRWKKTRGRLPPKFMNEELCHRNMAFSLYQADEMPLIELGETEVKRISDNIYSVRIDITNSKLAPTITARAAKNMVVRPDLIKMEGECEIISSSWINNKENFEYLKPITRLIDQKNLKRIIVRNGHPGRTTRTLQYLVKGSGKINIIYDSVKGGKVSKSLALR